MRTADAFVLALFAAHLAVAGSVRAQDRDDAAPLKNGEQIVVKGCLRGAMLEAMEAGRSDETLSPAAYTFQLKGKKELLKDLRLRHDGFVVQLSGTLKSNLESLAPGRQVGRTRIVVGADSTTRGGMPGMGDQPMPVLEVKAFEGSELSCRR